MAQGTVNGQQGSRSLFVILLCKVVKMMGRCLPMEQSTDLRPPRSGLCLLVVVALGTANVCVQEGVFLSPN